MSEPGETLHDGSDVTLPVIPDGLDLADCLGACITRAHITAKSENNDIYWYTREACLAIAKANGLKWTEVMSETRFSSTALSNIISRSEPLWLHVMHPTLRVQDVLNS